MRTQAHTHPQLTNKSLGEKEALKPVPHKGKEQDRKHPRGKICDTFFAAEKVEGFLTEERRNLQVQHAEKEGVKRKGEIYSARNPEKNGSKLDGAEFCR